MTPRPPEHVRSIRPYEPGKPVEEVERELGLGDTVKLASNENPLGPSPLALQALRQQIGDLNRYPDGGGYYLRRTLAQLHGLTENEVVLGNGSTELVEILARTYLGSDGNAVMSEKAFVMYRIAVTAVNGNAIEVPMRGSTHDLHAMADAIDERTRLVFVANPNNPTGTYVDRAAMDHLLSRLPEGALAVIDEAYREYVEGNHPDYPDLVPDLKSGARVVILRTFSKVYGLAGIRLGYALAPAGVISDLQRVRSPFNTNSLAQAAALAALEDQEHVRRSVMLNREGREMLATGLQHLGARVTPSVANFLLVEVPQAARDAFQSLLRQGVIVRPMDTYGFPSGLRISVGLPEENRRLLEAFGRLMGAR